RIAAGILLGRHVEAAGLFAAKADRLAGSPEEFAEVKAWAVRHGLAVEAVAYREFVRAEPPVIVARAAAIEERRAGLQEEVRAYLADPRLVAERLPETLAAFFAQWPLRPGQGEAIRLDATEVGGRILAAADDTQRALVLAALAELANAPRKVDDVHPQLWGTYLVHDSAWGLLIRTLLRRPLPCDEPF